MQYSNAYPELVYSVAAETVKTMEQERIADEARRARRETRSARSWRGLRAWAGRGSLG
jgi:hypothetical protein